ncbi:putative pentatricopeptide repeat-containing protein [Nymphaea thermarum]|nr:putative pentatricopeptide repeat-containing protein [Nymphaea thermarum]
MFPIPSVSVNDESKIARPNFLSLSSSKINHQAPQPLPPLPSPQQHCILPPISISSAEKTYRNFCHLLQSFVPVRSLSKGQQIHAHAVKAGLQSVILLVNHLINLYAKCDHIGDAQKLFDEMHQRVPATWSSLISGYAQNGLPEHALDCFRGMHRAHMFANEYTLASAAKACGAAGDAFRYGCSLHSLAVKTGFHLNVFVGSALVDMYSKHGDVGNAHRLFEEMPERNVVTWSGMIAGYVQNGLEEAALLLFKQVLNEEGMSPNDFTFSCLIRACGVTTALTLGMQLHSLCVKSSFDSSSFVGSSLVGLYSKCGMFQDARQVFNEMPERNVGAWNSILIACSQHGHTEEAFRLLDGMKAEGFQPNFITFLCILSACSHRGLVDTGEYFFGVMESVFGVEPNPEHYTCMVDMYARAGRLDEALGLIDRMPFKPTESVWGALLAGCRMHGDTERAHFAAEKLFQMGSKNSGTHLLLVNAYTTAGKWKEAALVRKAMRDEGVKKEVGLSWVAVGNKVHTFVADDKSHVQTPEIYAKLEELDNEIRKAGYVGIKGFASTDEVKERVVGYHSERLAVAFGLIRIKGSRPIRVMKNLRVCTDCHEAIKLVSKCTDRVIILRDNNRFHHFEHGLCSCGDYW